MNAPNYKTEESREFDRSVKNKFDVYNSLFLNLPFSNIRNIGVLIPLLNEVCKNGLEAKKGPLEILDPFFSSHANLKSEVDKIDFMFKVIH